MFCSKCGQQLNDDAQFCFSCGSRLDHGGKKGRKQKKTKTVLAVVLVILVLAAAAAGWLLIGGKPEQEQALENQTFLQNTLPEPEDPAQAQPTEETVSGETEETGEAELPTEGIQAVADSRDPAGIPLPEQPEEVRQQILEIYRGILESEAGASSYSLLNMLGDDIPELIVRCDGDGGSGVYRLYFVLQGQALQVRGDSIAAAEQDVLLGDSGKLLICRGDAVISVGIDQTLSAVVTQSPVQETVPYTDTVLTEKADSTGLLELVLLGNDAKIWYSDWVKFAGRSYFYIDRKPEICRWRAVGDTLYYLGASGYVTHQADPESLQAAMEVYCQEFMEAVNNQDASRLLHATDAHRKAMAVMLQEDMYQYRTFSDFDCSIAITGQNHQTGGIILKASVCWTSCGTWKGAEETPLERVMSVTLVHQDGSWLVDATA